MSLEELLPLVLVRINCVYHSASFLRPSFSSTGEGMPCALHRTLLIFTEDSNSVCSSY